MCIYYSQATVLEEMPAFPDRESSLLNKLYETAPWTAKLHQEAGGSEGTETTEQPPPVVNGVTEPAVNIGAPVDPLISTSKSIPYHLLTRIQPFNKVLQ